MAIYEAVFFGLYYGQAWNNKVHFESVEANVTAQSVSTALAQNWVPSMKAMQVNDVQWFGVSVKTLGQGLGEQFTTPLNTTGGQAGEPQRASFIAGVVQKKTGLAGRANRGRIYVPGIRGGATHLGLIDAPEIEFWRLRLDEIRGNFISSQPFGVRLVLKHPEGSTPVTEVVMRPILGVMRTRNIGVGA